MNVIKKLFSKLGSSLKNNSDPDTWSGKKIIAYLITACIIGAHIKWWNAGDFTLLPTILGMDIAFVLALYGINVADKKLNPVDSVPDQTAK